MTPRGIRNNNPGNLDYNVRNNWVGQVGLETGVDNPRFAAFSKPEYGIRALCKVIKTYHNKYGLKSIPEIISRWAPTNENNTAAYVTRVAMLSGIDPADDIDLDDDMFNLVCAIIQVENGMNPYTSKVVRAGIDMA